MYRGNLSLLLVVLSALTLVQCRKKASDNSYGRPEDLEPGIYTVLKEKGKFNTYLEAVDKAGYKQTLSGAGYWTAFVPHDSAFQVYFTANGISGIKDLDSAACRRIGT